MPGSTAPLALLEVLRRSTDYLRSRGCDSPRLESELLLAKALGVRRIDLYLQFDRPLGEEELAACRDFVRRRGEREPIAYILGEKEFRSLVFEVERNVFIPRPDTETIVELAAPFLLQISPEREPVFADVGTGSACLAVSILHETPRARAVATDVSARALAVAARNAARHGVADRVDFIECEYLDGAPSSLQFDAIVCNPPYVNSCEIPGLQPELRYEPREALSPPGDRVAAVFERMAAAAAARLRPGGAVFIEIGEGQADLIQTKLRAAGLDEPTIRNDLAGAPRVATARMPRR